MLRRISITASVAIFAMAFGQLKADEPAAVAPAAPPATPTWLITAKPDAATVHLKGDIKLSVTIKNNSTANQTVEVARNFWYAHSDNPAVKFWSWPERGGHGPVVMFKTMTLGPGESFSHDWTAQVSDSAKPGKTTFRVGIPLHQNPSQLEWSEPVTVEITAEK